MILADPKCILVYWLCTKKSAYLDIKPFFSSTFPSTDEEGHELPLPMEEEQPTRRTRRRRLTRFLRSACESSFQTLLKRCHMQFLFTGRAVTSCCRPRTTPWSPAQPNPSRRLASRPARNSGPSSDAASTSKRQAAVAVPLDTASHFHCMFYFFAGASHYWLNEWC